MECAGVAAGSKILVGESADACRAFASKPARAAKVVIRADTRFSGPASLANRFVTSKGTCVTPRRSEVVQRTQTGRAGGKSGALAHITTEELTLSPEFLKPAERSRAESRSGWTEALAVRSLS